MIKVGLIGVGKMGISHFSILGAHPNVEVSAICDSANYLTSGLKKYTGVAVYKDYQQMLNKEALDCIFVATPTRMHFEIVKYAIEKGISVFAEKPLCLHAHESKQLSDLAIKHGVANQVGYHNRFIGTFIETKRLVNAGAIGEVYHIEGSAFGQVVIKPKTGSTWRSKKSSGGGCLQDYASHVVDLMNFIIGPPEDVLSAQFHSVYSDAVEDAVYASFKYANGASGRLETNWSDESYRKMSTTVTLYGRKGKIISDRQECRVFMKAGEKFEDYEDGWTSKYITELQSPVNFYLRGEEYSSQIDNFISAVEAKNMAAENSFASAYETDRTIELIRTKAS